MDQLEQMYREACTRLEKAKRANDAIGRRFRAGEPVHEEGAEAFAELRAAQSEYYRLKWHVEQAVKAKLKNESKGTK